MKPTLLAGGLALALSACTALAVAKADLPMFCPAPTTVIVKAE